jgi:hypothetical protein
MEHSHRAPRVEIDELELRRELVVFDCRHELFVETDGESQRSEGGDDDGACNIEFAAGTRHLYLNGFLRLTQSNG